MEPEVPVKKLETMVKLDAVRRMGQRHPAWRMQPRVTLPVSQAASVRVSRADTDYVCIELHPRLWVCECVCEHERVVCMYERHKEQ